MFILIEVMIKVNPVCSQLKADTQAAVSNGVNNTILTLTQNVRRSPLLTYCAPRGLAKVEEFNLNIICEIDD